MLAWILTPYPVSLRKGLVYPLFAHASIAMMSLVGVADFERDGIDLSAVSSKIICSWSQEKYPFAFFLKQLMNLKQLSLTPCSSQALDMRVVKGEASSAIQLSVISWFLLYPNCFFPIE